MKKIAVREKELVATLFHQPRSSTAIIVLGGSSGGLNEARAEKLAQLGFSTLALAYFAAEALPATLKHIPLEYFLRAMDWLQARFSIDRLALWGGSRGAEAALLLGALFPERISAIAAHVPSSVVYGALDLTDAPAWIYGGKPLLPNAPFIFPSSFSGETEQNPILPTPLFLQGMQDQKAFHAAAIPVENLRCPLLLISGQDDQMWPSALFAQQIIDRLAAHGSPIQRRHLSYPQTGHAPSKGVAGFHPILKRWVAYGGSPEANAFAAQDWWEQTVRFFVALNIY